MTSKTVTTAADAASATKVQVVLPTVKIRVVGNYIHEYSEVRK